MMSLSIFPNPATALEILFATSTPIIPGNMATFT
jgi:hypothetical protein